MSRQHQPIIGHWYETADSKSLKVINIDDASGTIEIQYLDGAHHEIDFDIWNSWKVDSIVPPKDWEGLCDDDLGDSLVDDSDDDFADDNSANDELWEDNGFLDEESDIKEY